MSTRSDQTTHSAQRTLRVLLVDGHQLFRTGLRELLEDEGFKVEDTGTGEAALRRAPKFAPDVAVMDLRLPDVSGIEVTRRLRETAPATAALILTLAAEEELILHAVRAGASGYMLKSAELEQITAAIRGAAEGNCPFSPCAARALVDQVRLSRAEEAAPAPAPRLSARLRRT